MSPHNLVKCEKCERLFQKEDIEAHKSLHDKQWDICIICGLGMIILSEDQIHATCENCSTTWTKQGHEKPLSDRIWNSSQSKVQKHLLPLKLEMMKCFNGQLLR